MTQTLNQKNNPKQALPTQQMQLFLLLSDREGIKQGAERTCCGTVEATRFSKFLILASTNGDIPKKARD
jgi:hypothetical protein